jgi:hypothetical protein
VTDAKGRYCEDAVQVTVGEPPHGLPPKVAEQPRPKPGEALSKKTVVLPFNDMAMQSGYPTYGTIYPWESINNLNAQVIRKGSVGAGKPVILDNSDVTLDYSAASNPRDPAGPGSINSTSQNWPVGGGHAGHGGLQKFDNFWGTKKHPGAFDMAIWWLAFQGATYDGDIFVSPPVPPDEGLRSRHNSKVPGEYSYGAKAKGQGRRMPGFGAPYESNKPQDFSTYLKGLGQFTAEALPLTNIDDQGRLNNFPLMRVEARDKNTGKVLSMADAVVTHGSDFQCRECHLKGQIGSDPTVKRKPSKFNYNNPAFNQPTYVDAASNSIADLEKAAIRNVAGLHTWYDFYPWAKGSWGSNPDDPKDTDWKMDAWIDSGGHTGWACNAHHTSTVAAEFNIQQPMLTSPLNLKPDGDYPLLSKSMHGWHGRLQQDSRGKLIRDTSGNPVLWNVAKGSNPNTLFPTGKGAKMEDNCLRCHAGKREQLYRDRMYTAGVQCVDCHGDMLATAQLHKKPKGGFRQEWLEQPDCGSCHSGFGKDPVAKVAYDPKDLSATTLRPKSDRFAVQPATVLIRTGGWVQDAKGEWHLSAPFKSHASTAFRHSRDTHGKVACAACHGAAHAIWPNRDPNANDNVTALQLQGHTGSVNECSVCHTKDAFKKGQVDKNGDGILAGPHGTHPINDPSWFAGATDSAGKFIQGGWHGKYTWRPGKNGEEQCSACHGADHQGTRLAKVPVDREYRDHTGKPRGRLKAGEQVSCALCHSLEVSFGGRW